MSVNISPTDSFTVLYSTISGKKKMPVPLSQPIKERKMLHSTVTIISDKECIRETVKGAYVDLVKVIPPNTRNPSPNLTSTTPVQKPTSAPSLKSESIFEAMKDLVSANIEKVKQVNGIFLYQITQKGSSEPAAKWTLDFKKGNIYKGDPAPGAKVDTTITVDDGDFFDIATGKLNPQVAFMKGKLKIKGNIMLTQKLQSLMTQSKL